jgi:predicted permease
VILHPPPLFAWLLKILPAEAAEGIAGDLEEAFQAQASSRGRLAARWWYRRQVASVLLSYAHDRVPARRPSIRRGSLMDTTRQDVAHAIRSLRKHPGYASIAVLLLALGIGTNVAMFSLVNGVLLAPLPFHQPDRLMLVHLVAPARFASERDGLNVWSYPKYEVLKQHQRVFEATALYGIMNWNITGTGLPERVFGEFAESSYFPLLGVAPAVGRTFSESETRIGSAAALAVISHRLWLSRFGGDVNVVGRTLGLNGAVHTIVGVMPSGFVGLTGQADLWVPIATIAERELSERWSHRFYVIARLREGMSPADARAAIEVLGGVIDERHRAPMGGTTERWGATARSLQSERVDPTVRTSLLILLGALAAVLFIVCITLAHLTLVRAIERRREMSIRVALGASRLRVVRLLMAESLVLAVASGAAALVVAYLLMSAGAAMLPDLRLVLPSGRASGLTRVGLGLVGLDARTVCAAVGISCVASLLFGLGPALRASHSEFATTMKLGASGAIASGSRRFALHNMLTIAQVALAFVLLAAGGLMLKSLAALQRTELGFDADSVVTVRLSMPMPKYNAARATQMFDQLLERLSANPQIVSIAFGNCPPVSGGCSSTAAQFPGRPPVPRGQEPEVGVFWASSRYFETMRIPVKRGRTFTEHDRTGQPKVVVVNETAARTLWAGENPIGQRIGVGQGGFWDGAEVIGVVGDVRYDAVPIAARPDVYLPLLQSPRAGGILFIRTRGGIDAVLPAVRAEIAALDPDLPVIDVRRMTDRFSDATWRTRTSASLLGTFAAFALLLAALGVYGMVSQGVEQRTREIGVRLALGAKPSEILRLVLGRVAAISIGGVAVGIATAIPATRLLTELLYQVRPGDPVIMATLATVLVIVALVAGYLPARRATRIDPLITLRTE